jgi:hypothetical protein
MTASPLDGQTPLGDPADAFGAPTLAQLTGLVFELASQLHVERVQRIALEAALKEAGLLDSAQLTTVAVRAEARARAAPALERAMRGLMRVLTEDAGPKTPLRAQSPFDPQ